MADHGKVVRESALKASDQRQDLVPAFFARELFQESLSQVWARSEKETSW